jgi:hypothetical protein
VDNHLDSEVNLVTICKVSFYDSMIKENRLVHEEVGKLTADMTVSFLSRYLVGRVEAGCS